jgi:beta-lactamase class A
MLAVLERVCDNRLRLDQRLDVKELTGDSSVFDEPRKASVIELLVWMIILSDNTATNTLIDLMGFHETNTYMKYKLKLTNTILCRKMLDFESQSAGIDNLTTACDMFRVYKQLFEYKILSPDLCNEAIWILRKQRDNRAFTRYIWEDAAVAHKTGGLDYLSHDCGIFSFGHKQVYLGVFIQNAPELDGNPKLIGRVAREVYDTFWDKEC